MENLTSDTEQFVAALYELSPSFGLSLSELTVERLVTHFQLLSKWNRKLNLTAVLSPYQAAQFHYLESLFGATVIESDIETLADVGSGAGFPGLPMAVVLPRTLVTLVERDSRKAIFLKEAVRHMRLQNVHVLHKHIGSFSDLTFDALICRAIQPVKSLFGDEFVRNRCCRQIVLFCNQELANTLEQVIPQTFSFRRLNIPLTHNRILVTLHL